MRAPPHTVFLRCAVPKISKAVTQNRRAGELSVTLAIFDQCLFQPAFDAVSVCMEYPKPFVSGTHMVFQGKVSPWLCFVLLEILHALEILNTVKILQAVCSSRDVRAARRPKHLAFTSCNGIFCWCSWCGSSWAHFTPQLSCLPSQPHSVLAEGSVAEAARGSQQCPSVIYSIIIRAQQPQEWRSASDSWLPSNILAEQDHCPCVWCWGTSLQTCCISDSSGNF